MKFEKDLIKMEKKKSKKQLQTFADNGHSENNNNSLIDVHDQKKKKKKKKENEDINSSLSQKSPVKIEEPVVTKKKKNKREQQEPEESPRKKKKTNKEREVESPRKKEKLYKEEENAALQTSAQNVDPLEGTPRSKKKKKVKSEEDSIEAVIDEDWWPAEERTAMLEAMKVQVSSSGRFTKSGYLSALRKTNWEDVLDAINTKVPGNSRNVEQCKVQFNYLLHRIGTIKSLGQILDDGLNLASDPGALRREVPQARHRFVREYMLRNKCTLTEATKLWRDIPEEEKAKWEEEYQNELRQKGLTDAKSKKKINGPEHCKHPFELYLEARAAKGEVLSAAEAKSKYGTLSLKKKIPFIVESLKQQKVYEAEAAKYLEKNPSWKKTKAHGPTLKEVKDYLESIGLPLAPPSTHITMYYQEEREKFTNEKCSDNSEKVNAVKDSLKPYQRAREALSNLPQKQQKKYKLEWKKSWEEYLSEVEKWKPIVEENHPEILEQALAALAAVKVPNLSEGPEKKKSGRKVPVNVLANIERQTSALTNVKFNDEPKLPSRTGYELFVAKFKKDAGASFNQTRAKELWGKLTEEKKAVYTDRVEVLKQRAKAHFLSYASELEGPQRKLYVGVKREQLVKYFQEDIFAEDYPGTDYPILISAPKTPKKSTDKDAKSNKVAQDSEDDFQPSKSTGNLKKGGAAKNKEQIKEESEDEDEDEEGEKEEEENESSSSDNESGSESESEVEASQPTPVSPFSLTKSGKNSSSLSAAGNSSPFSVKLAASKDESSGSEDESDDETDEDNNKENYETPLSSRAQSKTNQRSGLATSTPAVKDEMTSDSEASSDSSDSEEDIGPAWKNTSSTATPIRKVGATVKKEESSDDSSEEESD